MLGAGADSGTGLSEKDSTRVQATLTASSSCCRLEIVFARSVSRTSSRMRHTALVTDASLQASRRTTVATPRASARAATPGWSRPQRYQHHRKHCDPMPGVTDDQAAFLPTPRYARHRGMNMAACWPERPPRSTAGELASARGYLRRIFSNALPLASSSMSLSR
jgi:hypothetical protein